MSAYRDGEQLRAAAAKVREDGEVKSPALCALLADLLEAINDPYTAMPDGVILSLDTAIRRRGVALARAINGGTS